MGNAVVTLQSVARGRFAKAELDDAVGSEVATIPPETVAEEALGSRETPSQQDPKGTCKDSQDLHLVNASPEDVSSEPHVANCSSATATILHSSRKSSRRQSSQRRYTSRTSSQDARTHISKRTSRPCSAQTRVQARCERNTTPQRKVVRVKNWYIKTSSNGTRYIRGLFYGHTRYRDNSIMQIRIPDSVDANNLRCGYNFNMGTHKYLLDIRSN